MSARAALPYLVVTSLRNRARLRLRRLRQPRYALALALGVGYVWLFLLRPQPSSRMGTTALFGLEARAIATLGVGLLVAGAWLFAGGRLALAFAPAEVDFLFPAPLTRRQLVGYKVGRAQLVVVFNTVLWVFILRRGGSTLPAGLRAIAMWLFFTTLYLHRIGAGIVRASWAEHGRTGIRRQRLTTALFVAVVAALVWSLVAAVPRVVAGRGGADVFAVLAEAVSSGPARVALAPLRWMLAPAFALDAREWLGAILPALALCLIHVAWVLRADVAFEEAAIEASRERARRIEALRARREGGPVAAPTARRRLVIPLAPRGAAWRAIVWKNALAFARTVQLARLVSVLVMAIGIGAGVAAASPVGTPRFVAIVAAIAAALLVLLGPRIARNDLRLDVAALDVVKTLPLPGRTIVVAEVASSVAVVAALQLALLVVAGVALGVDSEPLPPWAWLAAPAAWVGLVALDAISLAWHNAAAVLLPSWVQTGSVVGGGVEVLGQAILTTVASLVLVALALLPPLLVGAAAMIGVESVVPSRALALAVGFALALATVAAELALLASWLGRAFERLEPSEARG